MPPLPTVVPLLRRLSVVAGLPHPHPLARFAQSLVLLCLALSPPLGSLRWASLPRPARPLCVSLRRSPPFALLPVCLPWSLSFSQARNGTRSVQRTRMATEGKKKGRDEWTEKGKRTRAIGSKQPRKQAGGEERNKKGTKRAMRPSAQRRGRRKSTRLEPLLFSTWSFLPALRPRPSPLPVARALARASVAAARRKCKIRSSRRGCDEENEEGMRGRIRTPRRNVAARSRGAFPRSRGRKRFESPCKGHIGTPGEAADGRDGPRRRRPRLPTPRRGAAAGRRVVSGRRRPWEGRSSGRRSGRCGRGAGIRRGPTHTIATAA